jgi:hypothetical protein
MHFLYEETAALGGKGIMPNNTDIPSRVDIELLFNGLVVKKERLTELFTDKN